MSNLIDTHFHLDYYKNHKEIYNLINNLKQYTLCVTNSPEIYLSCKKMYPETQYVKFAVGFNPKTILTESLDMRTFNYAMKNTKYVGEVGLDFSKRYYSAKDLQIKAFEQIVNVAQSENKLMNIHSFRAEEAVLEILTRYKVQNAIIHWYTGSDQYIKDFIKIGCYFSINSNMIKSTYSSNFLRLIPSNRILVESDGPFTKVNNIKYEPALLGQSYEIIENFCLVNDFKKVVFDNFKSLLSQYP